jgi:hypothetical protein
MNLIDWPSLARNALWILGLSIVLAAWSYVSWLASQRKVRTWRATSWSAFEVPAAAGLTLFAASLAWGATRTWERLLWIALALAFLAQFVLGWRKARRQGWLPSAPASAAPGDSIDGSTVGDRIDHP